MARFSTRSWKNCATCRFWRGPRRLHAPMGAAEVEMGAAGVCGVRQDKLHWRPVTYATGSCHDWRTWALVEADERGVPA